MADLAHYIKVRFGCEPQEPTEAQVTAIVADIQSFVKRNGKEPTTDELGEIVRRHCPSAGRYKYASDVNADLRRQIALLAAQVRR